jgi:hypothetical protein
VYNGCCDMLLATTATSKHCSTHHPHSQQASLCISGWHLNNVPCLLHRASCRQDPVHRSTATGGTTWAAGGAWPSAAVPIQVQGEAASTCAFRAGFCGLLLTGLDVRAHSRGGHLMWWCEGTLYVNMGCLVDAGQGASLQMLLASI